MKNTKQITASANKKKESGVTHSTVDRVKSKSGDGLSYESTITSYEGEH